MPGSFYDPPVKAVFPPQNSHVLTVYAKWDEDFLELPDEDHSQITLTCQRAAVADILKTIAVQISLDHWPLQIPIRGIMTQNTSGGTPLAGCIMRRALQPVVLRRKAWPEGETCNYINDDSITDEGKHLLGFHSSHPLDALDFGANDWIIVSNPNIEEIIGEDDEATTPSDNGDMEF